MRVVWSLIVSVVRYFQNNSQQVALLIKEARPKQTNRQPFYFPEIKKNVQMIVLSVCYMY